MCRRIVESNHAPEHADSLVKGKEAIIGRVAVLLEKVVLDELGNVERDLVGLGEGALCSFISNRRKEQYLSHKLHNFTQILLLLQHLLDPRTQRQEFRVKLFIVGLERIDILAIAQRPIDTGKVLALCELLVQAPENLHDSQGRGRDGLAIISAGWGYSGCLCVKQRVFETYAPTMDTDPFRFGFPRHVTFPARS